MSMYLCMVPPQCADTGTEREQAHAREREHSSPQARTDPIATGSWPLRWSGSFDHFQVKENIYERVIGLRPFKCSASTQSFAAQVLQLDSHPHDTLVAVRYPVRQPHVSGDGLNKGLEFGLPGVAVRTPARDDVKLPVLPVALQFLQTPTHNLLRGCAVQEVEIQRCLHMQTISSALRAPWYPQAHVRPAVGIGEFEGQVQECLARCPFGAGRSRAVNTV